MPVMSSYFSNSCRCAASKLSHSACKSNPSWTSQRLFSTSSIQHFSNSGIRPQAPKTSATLPAAQAAAGTVPPKTIKELVQRYPQHPLLQFFSSVPESETLPESERKTDSDQDELVLPSSFSNFDTSKVVAASSRSWLAPELRLKSSHELHVLWYVLLMERNRLATSWDEVARVGARNLVKRSGENLSSRNHRVRKSMARIKFVLNERRLALIEAQKAVRSPGATSAVSQEDESLWEDISDEMDGKEPKN